MIVATCVSSLGQDLAIHNIPIKGHLNAMAFDLSMPVMKRWVVGAKMTYIAYYFNWDVVLWTVST